MELVNQTKGKIFFIHPSFQASTRKMSSSVACVECGVNEVTIRNNGQSSFVCLRCNKKKQPKCDKCGETTYIHGKCSVVNHVENKAICRMCGTLTIYGYYGKDFDILVCCGPTCGFNRQEYKFWRQPFQGNGAILFPVLWDQTSKKWVDDTSLKTL